MGWHDEGAHDSVALWSIPGHFVTARFESTEEGERTLVAAGFKFIPAENGFRA